MAETHLHTVNKYPANSISVIFIIVVIMTGPHYVILVETYYVNQADYKLMEISASPCLLSAEFKGVCHSVFEILDIRRHLRESEGSREMQQ